MAFNPGMAIFAQQNCYDGALLQPMCITGMDLIAGNNPKMNAVNDLFTLMTILHDILCVSYWCILIDATARHLRPFPGRMLFEAGVPLRSIAQPPNIPTI